VDPVNTVGSRVLDTSTLAGVGSRLRFFAASRTALDAALGALCAVGMSSSFTLAITVSSFASAFPGFFFFFGGIVRRRRVVRGNLKRRPKALRRLLDYESSDARAQSTNQVALTRRWRETRKAKSENGGRDCDRSRHS
jgi:hypothetical protein